MKKSELAALRKAFADYVWSEGCSCCRDTDKHEEAANRIAEILQIEPYADDSGWDFTAFRTGASDNGEGGQ